MKIKIIGISVMLGLCVGSVYSTENPKPDGNISIESQTDKISYAIGTQIGNSLKSQEIEINLDLLILGIKHVLDGKELAMSPEQIRETMMAFQKTMQEKMQKQRAEMQQKQMEEAEANLATGKIFLEANAKAEGVKTLDSGLQYKVIKEGTGNKPTAMDKVKVHYKGTLINGTEFDSSYKRGEPAEFMLNGVIKGWTEGLQLMTKGSKYQFFIPPDLAYGAQPRPTIPGNSVLIFEVELLEIVKPEPNESK